MNSTLYLDKKIVVFESDDWGRVGMRDMEAFERLKAKGYSQLGQSDWDYCSLEMPEDLEALYSVLCRHSDSFGLPPIFTCNFIVANPDYEKIMKSGFREFYTLDLSQGFPDLWKNREQLIDKYRKGVALGLIYPGYHGLCHFLYERWLRALQDREPDVMDCLEEHISYIPSMRSNAFSYEYLANVNPISFLSLNAQEDRIKKGVEAFERIFGFPPVVTIAPRYAWNTDTEKVWYKYGIRYISAGSSQAGGGGSPGHRLGERNQCGMIYLIRNVSFEARREDACEDAFTEVDFLFRTQQPVILETHSINYLTSIKNFREESLKKLDQLLYLIEKKYPEIVYLSSQQFGDILGKGYCHLTNGQRLEVKTYRTSLPYLGKFHFYKKKTALQRYLRKKSSLWQRISLNHSDM
ncbi:hypothetical protein C4544_06140 [candidate division WS5 bacterium]|uniref:Glycoside hydrolase family 57 N-terminal domain-containing protein n=1 Tax=candidate division WS5 bacterium TaxID=2093353 RepID=A0A419DAN6_9BACT|nr:MAG: hypothetical protein C4544_06140 [candidate division WS5 bacterium]